ncbi:MAG: aminotransferase class V-fold PLP-dependent enzyme, partial [FCB group bacterium]|nr:aminotransferase class V-fold PLP-dependent enzyme [FCB group bacterium]
EASARLLGCDADEVAMLGPTSLGLNLVAAGLPWRDGDEVVYYPDDYPANVYPWSGLEARGVKPVGLRPERPGRITWELVKKALTPRTRLVALASCHFMSGYRIDVDGIGRQLRERDILFSLDGIQTLGAFPVSVEYVDFLSADSHKWLLGPMGAGIFYVKRSRMETLRPVLLGALNVVSPDYVAQEEIRFHSGARRYEPGTLAFPGILGMRASMELLLEAGIEAVGQRILALRRALLEATRPKGYRLYVEDEDCCDGERSGIVSLVHPERDVEEVAARLKENGVALSLRRDREGRGALRFSPHFYNTFEEMEKVASVL